MQPPPPPGRPAAAARVASPSSSRDYIDSLRGDPDPADDTQPTPAPLVRRVHPKKAAIGVARESANGDIVNQLLVSMTQPAAAPAPSPQPRRRRRSTARSSPRPNQQQQQQQAAAANSRAAAAAAVPDPGSGDDFVCPPGIICAQQGSKICGDGELASQAAAAVRPYGSGFGYALLC